MPETPREASPPTIGAVRDGVRTTLAFLLALLLTKVVGEETAMQMSGAIEAVVVVIVSALFAWGGKLLRNKASILGEII